MANDSVGAMLLDLGLDLSPVQNAARVITATMGDLNRITAQVEANATKAATAQKAPLNDMELAAKLAVQAALDAIEANKKLSAQVTQLTTSQVGLKQALDRSNEALRQSAFNTDAAAGATKRLGDANKHAVSDIQATSGAIRVLDGNGGIRAAERFIASTLGLGSVFQYLFPVIGAVAVVSMLAKVGEKLYKFIDGAKDIETKVKAAFDHLNDSVQATNDKLQETNDRLRNQIAALEKKPQNTVKIWLDEIRIAADELASSLDTDISKLVELAKKNETSMFQQLLGAAGTSDITTELEKFQTKVADQARLAKAQIDIATNPPEAHGVQLFDKTSVKNMANAARANMQQTIYQMYTDEILKLKHELSTVNGGGGDSPNTTRLRTILTSAISNLSMSQQGLGYKFEGTDLKNKIADLGEQKRADSIDLERQDAKKKYFDALDALATSYAEAQKAKREVEIADEKEQDDARYRGGEESLKTHIDNQLRIQAEANKAKLDEMAQAHKDRVDALGQARKEIDTKVKDKKIIDPATIAFEYSSNTLATDKENQTYTASQSAQEKANARAVSGITGAGDKDRIAAGKAQIEDQLKQQTEYVQSLQKLNQKAFDIGDISPEEYLAKQFALYNQDADAKIDAAARVAVLDEKNSKAQIDRWNKEVEARRAALDQIEALEEQYYELRQKAIEKRYKPQQDILKGQLAEQQANPDVAGTGNISEISIVRELVTSLTANRNALQSTLPKDPQGRVLETDQSFATLAQIQTLNTELAKYTLQLQNLRDITEIVARTFSSLGEDVGGVFKSKFGQNLGQVLTSASKESGLTSTAVATWKKPKAKTIKTDPNTQALGSQTDATKDNTNWLGTLTQAIQHLIDTMMGKTRNSSGEADSDDGNALPGGEDGDSAGEASNSGGANSTSKTPDSGDAAATGLQAFSKAITSSISAVVGFVSTITNAKSAISGAAGGALSGGEAGGQIAGPIGAAIGATVGAITGGIVGGKQQKVTNEINELNTTYKNLMNQFAANTNNLQSTISQLTSLMAQAEAMQANSKKGSSQFQQLIDQYSQQIIQLQDQQAQTLRQMNQQVAILTEPVGAQSYLTDLQSILQQYQQFEGAAASTTDLANANQFLLSSLQAYEQNLSSQLLQDNTQAIQDALQLNDLLYQRQQLTLQYSQQVQSVLSQGVLTRQMTRAQTAGQQIELMNITYQQQMDQLNEQISAETYKVSMEQQIFDLAQTRIGLENQLVTVQNAQTNLDMERIQALQSLVNQIASSNFGIGALGALLNAYQTVTNPVAGGNATTILQALQQLFGGGNGTTPTTTTGADVFEVLSGQSYQSRAQLGFGAYRGQNLNS